MTNKRKNRILELAYDLAYELERIDGADYDYLIDNGGKCDSLKDDVDTMRNVLSKLKTR